MAEIEIGVMSRQCLAWRTGEIERMRYEVAAWVRERNAAQGTVRWYFTSADARVKLRRLYPKI
jgi:hypothetical protein